MAHFTPFASTFGGMLIGLSAALLWLGLGRITGISGILAGALEVEARGWRGLFLLGLVAAPLLLMAVGSGPLPTISAGPLRLVLAGLLVGFGTRFGGGCTSGHGVCGMARLSKRSMVATLTFMVTAALSVFVSRHLMGG